MSEFSKYVVIVAGGKGLRMGSEIPKQFLECKGLPVLMHTLNAFYLYDKTISIFLVLPLSHHAFWKELCEKYSFELAHMVVEGGETRFHSVKNGLLAIGNKEGVVAIHDGVRPFVSQESLEKTFETAIEKGSAVLGVPVKDSLRKIDRDASSNIAVNRENYVAVQTPQVFHLDKILQAFNVDYDPSFTDDATVYEKNGGKIELVMGDYENIKITTQEDMLLGQAILEKRQNQK